MAIEMVRVPSEIANIQNTDDFIGLRYAYGNQNGYIIGKGSKLDHTLNGRDFTIESGRIVLQGVESDIDANGVTLTIDAVSETRYYSVYNEVNLATNTSTIKMQFDSITYPNIESGDDLTANSIGVARLELYRFIATNGIISDIQKIVKAIDYTGTALVGYDESKGTIEERLNKLGFKTGSITLASGNTATKNELRRQGNYIIGSLNLSEIVVEYNQGMFNGFIGTLPDNFKPLNPIIENLPIYIQGVYVDGYCGTIIISSNGEMHLIYDASNVIDVTYTTSFYIENFGYEAKPIE